MYNLDSHYENIFHLSRSIIADPLLVYLHPFGSTSPENVEILNASQSEHLKSIENQFLKQQLTDLYSGNLLFCFDQEPLDFNFNKELFNQIDKLAHDNYGKRSIILLNTEKHSEEKNKILDEFKFIDVNYFFHGLAVSDWYRSYYYDARLTPIKQRTLNKKFITFNRITGNGRIYRSLLIAELADVVNQGYVSYSDHCPVHQEHYSQSLIKNYSKYNLEYGYAHEAIKKLDKINFPLRIDSDEKEIPNGSYSLGPIPELMSSFLHIVTETMFWDKRTHLTEKIFKPIVAKQPFVLVGCANNLEYLKSYGFKTFDRWWDESYDSITDPIQRLQAVSKIVKDICKLSDSDLTDMLFKMEEVLEHNYNTLYSREFIKLILSEIEQGLSNIDMINRDYFKYTQELCEQYLDRYYRKIFPIS